MDVYDKDDVWQEAWGERIIKSEWCLVLVIDRYPGTLKTTLNIKERMLLKLLREGADTQDW